MKTPDPTGVELLRDAARTKSTAFTLEERARYKLRGLLPRAPGRWKVNSRAC